MPGAKDSVITVIKLNHKVNEKNGNFVMVESYRKPDARILSFSKSGTWTTVLGSDEDDDASVLQMELPEEVLFFLWVDDNTIQKLDAIKREIEPAESYILIRKKKEINEKKDALTEREMKMNKLTGTYKGKQPCGDCRSLLATLTLKYKLHALSGEYTLSEKYISTKSGDIVTERKGKWTVSSKKAGQGSTTLFIVLDKQKPGSEMWFQVKMDGLQRVDKNQQTVNIPDDQVLKKQ